MTETTGKRTTVTGLGTARWLKQYAERLCAGADVAEVLDEVIAWGMKTRERVQS